MANPDDVPRNQVENVPGSLQSTPSTETVQSSHTIQNDTYSGTDSPCSRGPGGKNVSPGAEPLAYRPKEAALALQISERHLWTLTNQGKIPHCRIGRAVVYPVALLKDWLAGQAKGVG